MIPRVKNIIKIYENSNIQGVYEYLSSPEMIVDPNSWAGHIKKSLDDGLSISVLAEIELIKEKFNFYKNV